jgi:ubiquitin-like protein Pup
MAKQETKEKQTPKQEESTSTEAKDIKDEELAASTDELIDAIDEVLEENAEEFVKAYVQRGGE